MSYIKNCNKCGRRISLRQMSAGQWVAFNPGTETLHNCNEINEKTIKLKSSKKKYFKKSSEPVDYSTKREYENYIEKIASEDSEPDKNNFFLRIITWVFWGSLFYFVFLN